MVRDKLAKLLEASSQEATAVKVSVESEAGALLFPSCALAAF